MLGQRGFLVSAPGRIFLVTSAVALAGSGALAVSGPGPRSVSWAACTVIACIVGFGLSSMLSVYRFTWVALAIAFFGAYAGGPCIAALSVLPRAGLALGWALLALSLLPLAVLIVATLRPRSHHPPRATGARTADAHA
jgi:hypothetical protein